MRFVYILFALLFFQQVAQAQQTGKYQRSSLNLYLGTSGANVRQFNEILEERGGEHVKSGYGTMGMGYQTRFNDFIVGAEIYHNSGGNASYLDYDIDFRTTRLFLNVGYSYTEEGRFHLIHYMSLGLGSMNFQMLKPLNGEAIDAFLAQPERGYILRKNNIQRGTQYFGGFLTEIGFQVGYDLYVPRMEEVVSLIAKFGYSFNPFEESWNKKEVSFDNTQNGAFLRMGAAISLPESRYFYRDASLGLQAFYGLHFTKPNELNRHLRDNGYQPFSGIPENIGLKVLGEKQGVLYGIDLYNLAMSEVANSAYVQTLNSIRVYANWGRKVFDHRNIEMGLVGGVGYGNLRYSLVHRRKPDFPGLLDIPDYDGELKSGGVMVKPEIFLDYAMPLSKKKSVDLIYSVNAGYELPIGSYELADLGMRSFMSGPYLQFGLGVRP